MSSTQGASRLAHNTESENQGHAIAALPAAVVDRSWISVALWRIAILATLLGSWELSSRYLIDPFWFSKPSAIFARLTDWVVSGSLWIHLEVTVLEMILGFVLGSIVGVLTGLLLGLNPTLARIIDPFIVGVYSLPKIALAPLFILWLGVGLLSKVALVTLVVFFLVFYNTYSGVLAVDQELVDVLRLMKARRDQIITKVMLPSAVIWIFTGMKISVPYALIGAVVGEMMASNRGLGYLIQASAGQFDTTGVFSALAVLLIISLSLHALLKKSEGAMMRWKSEGA